MSVGLRQETCGSALQSRGRVVLCWSAPTIAIADQPNFVMNVVDVSRVALMTPSVLLERYAKGCVA